MLDHLSIFPIQKYYTDDWGSYSRLLNRCKENCIKHEAILRAKELISPSEIPMSEAMSGLKAKQMTGVEAIETANKIHLSAETLVKAGETKMNYSEIFPGLKQIVR